MLNDEERKMVGELGRELQAMAMMERTRAVEKGTTAGMEQSKAQLQRHDLLIGVLSARDHFLQRDTIRSTWIRSLSSLSRRSVYICT